ncbi:SNARE associated golgi protein [Hirsutella rhossiliensis]|uniref:Golgi apparatus membrane protein TVP38 n=1 Tax=Hirsutella rhossiliensis TaxID=111463 RepID=A0A9P8MXP5_9HYPO|nr:SNARE associated golgi protein [Hirsutella rhossiliensis]KAH0963160.1 SNARE associated golgi protein [Hirsutella rhossiliensis]
MALELTETGRGGGSAGGPPPRPSLSSSHSSSSSPPPLLTESPSPPSPSSPSSLPPWSRGTRMSPYSRAPDRLSSGRPLRSLSSRGPPPPRRQRPAYHPAELLRAARAAGERLARAFIRLTPAQRALAAAAGAAGLVALVLAVVYSHRFFAWLTPHARAWRERRGGWLLVFALIFAAAFPPLVGYSTATTLAGFVYGFPAGWPLAAAACVAGSLCAFLASRTVLSAYVDRLVGRDHRFVALGQVLRRDGLWCLTGIRFCPLPYSLSNGFLATIPSITPLAFTLSTALSSPKLLVHVFIGSRLAALADKGNSMTAGDKAINYLSMFLGSAVGIGVGLIIYRRTAARAAQLAREGAADLDADDDFDAAAEQADAGYHDSDAALLDPEDAAAVMLDDDLLPWDADGTSGAPPPRYEDEDRGAGQGKYNGRPDDASAV